MNNPSTLKERAVAEVDARREMLIGIADTIHANPEVAFAEYAAAQLLSGTLERNGFTVHRVVADLETAFVATAEGSADGPTVAFLAEYDALPGLGHACGHNLIGTASMGAGLAVGALLPELAGTIQVIGTPAEEQGGGKAALIDAGVFDRVDAAMMVHPSTRNRVHYRSLAYYSVRVEFFGKAAHAAVKPEAGINALNAVLFTFRNIDGLRQHLRDDARVHGIITNGGSASNIIPDYAEALLGVRALDVAYADEVLQSVRACAEGAARATGARLEFGLVGPRYDPMANNPPLVGLVEANMREQGLELKPPKERGGMGASDMGNVSQVVPAVHPGIGSEEMGSAHTVERCQAAASPVGHEAMIKAAKVMAMTAVDLLAQPANMAEVKRAFARNQGK